MVDARFHGNSASLTLSDIAAITSAELKQKENAQNVISGLAPLDTACANDISFLDNIKYVEAFAKSKAGACFVRKALADNAPAEMSLLITEQPYYCYALLSNKMYEKLPPSGIDKTAIIGNGAVIGNNVYVGAYSVIGDNVQIGDNTIISSNCSISHSIIGGNCIIHPGVRIGQDGFGFAPYAKGMIKVPQLGRVIIGNNVEIGANTCIDRGSSPDTIIGDGTKIDNLVQIGHNVQIGKNCVIVSQVGIAGSTIIGDAVMIGGQAGLSGHLKIGVGAKIAAGSGVIHDVPNGATFGGCPAIPVRDWHRQTIALSKIAKSRLNN